MLLSLFFLLHQALTQVLFLESFTTTVLTTNENWQFLNSFSSLPITTCNGNQIIGGFQEFGLYSAAYTFITLPPHYKIRMEFELYIIDTWDLLPNEYMKVFVDEQLVFKQVYVYNQGTQNLCGQSGNNRNDKVHQISIEFYHNSRTAYIELTSTVDSIPFDESWGFRNFRLFLYQCPNGCQTCTKETSELECQSWTLQSSYYLSIDQTQFTTDGWLITGGNNQKQICSTIPIVCGYNQCGMSTVISTQITLPFHSRILIKFKYLKFDNWKITDQSQLKIDGKIIWKQILSLYEQYQQSICGSSGPEIFINVEILTSHNKQYTQLSFENTLDQSTSIESFGIRDIEIFIQQSICGDRVIQEGEQCDDGNFYPFDGCFNCEYSCSDGCNLCNFGICLSCFDGWKIDKTQHICELQQIQQSIELQSDFNNLQLCNEDCKECFQGQCIQCNDGFYLNNLNNLCYSICGDLQIQKNEECDSFDLNCIECQLKCPQFCQECQFGQCTVCQSGYQLNNFQRCDEFYDESNQNNLCLPSCINCIDEVCYECQQGYSLILGNCQQICGNSQLAIYSSEECICDSKCTDCRYNICYQCIENYIPYENQCLNICGNSILQDNEECDDGNEIEFDGCYNCQFSCSFGCSNCFEGKCLDQCNYGYYYVNGQCGTICGDMIIAGNEQCDDGNLIKTDGCNQCEYLCSQNCNNCIQGICFECQEGFELIENICLNVCGDGILSNQEECDDNNLSDGDGCSSNCYIEKNWICKNGSECNYVVYPEIIVQFIVQKNQYQYVELKFSQQVYLKENLNLSSQIELSILDLNQSFYNCTIMEIQAAQYLQVTEVNYIFQIEISTSLDYQPLLIINLKQQLYNILDAPLDSLNSYVQLQQPNYITKEQEEIAGTFKTINEASVKSICALTLFLMLIGNALSFWGVLDALQEQSYLRFINVLYPQTLMIYFESSKIISVQPALDYITLYKNEGKFFQFPYLQSYEKFQFYQINADIGENIRAQILIFFTLFCTIIGTHFGIIILMKLEQIQFLQTNPKLVRMVQKIRWKIFLMKQSLLKTGIKMTLKANCWDLIFMSLLQLKAQTSYITLRDYICKLLATIVLFTGFIITIYNINGIKQWKKVTFHNFWKEKFEIFQVLKKFMILYVLVYQQQQQECQTIILTAIGVFYLIYIIHFKVFENQQEQLKAIIMEISVTLFSASTFINWNLSSYYLTYDEKILISWIQMSILAIVLLQFILIEIYNTVNQVITKIREAKKKKEEKELKKQQQQQQQDVQKEQKDTIFQRAKYTSKVYPVKFQE